MSAGKKAVSLILCLCLLLPLWGCGGRELYERLLIHGIGVDTDGESFTVTVRSSISPEDEGEEYFKCQGSSVLEALNSLTLSTGRKPFYAHNYLVVFGRKCAELGLDRCLDFFVRYYNTRPAVLMYLAEDTAEEILSSQKDGKYLKMSELQQLGRSSRDNGKSASVEILDFVNALKREGSSPVLPVLKGTDSGVEVASTAYFDGYRLKGFLSLEETRGWLAVTDRVENGETVVNGEDFGTVTLSLSKGSSQIEVSEGESGLPQLHILVEIEGDVSAVSGGRDRLEDRFYPEVEAALSDALRQKVESAIERAVLRGGCDIFGFGNLLYQRCPSYWRKNGESWGEQMSQCAYAVTVKARVSRLEQEELEYAVGSP